MQLCNKQLGKQLILILSNETLYRWSVDWAKSIIAEQKTFNTTAQANLLIAQQVKSRKRNRQKDDVADGRANKKIKLESGATIAGTIETEPTESEVVVKGVGTILNIHHSGKRSQNDGK